MSSASRRDNLGLVIVYLAIFGLKKKKKKALRTLAVWSAFFFFFFLFATKFGTVKHGREKRAAKKRCVRVRVCICVPACVRIEKRRA